MRELQAMLASLVAANASSRQMSGERANNAPVPAMACSLAGVYTPSKLAAELKLGGVK